MAVDGTVRDEWFGGTAKGGAVGFGWRAASAALVAAAIASGLAAAGPARALERLTFHAPLADDDLVSALRVASVLIAAREEGRQSPADYLAAARAEYARLIGALYAQGYYGGTVSVMVDGREAASIPPLATPDRIDVIAVTVDHGPIYRFSEAVIGPLAAGTEIPEGYATGEIAQSGVLQDAVDAAVDGWREVGHAKADLAAQRVAARHAETAIAADIDIAPGPRLRFGRLILEGESAVSPRRIRKIASVPSGEVFDPDRLDRAGERLRGTGVFRSVAVIEAETPNPDGTLDITAQIVDLPPRRFGIGAEVQTVEGVTLSAFWLHRNLFGGAERFRIEGEVTNLGGGTTAADYEIEATLARPATLDAETDAVLTARAASLNEDEYSEDTVTFGLGFQRRATETVTARASLEYRFSDVTDPFGQREYSQVFLPLGATLDTREDLLNPVDGFYLDLELAPFLGLDDSDDGLRFEFDGRAYRGFGAEDGTVIAARLQGGAIAADRLISLPAELRFYSGGGGSVRGQEYESLGVIDGSGRFTGGRNWLGVQTEIRQQVRENISLVGFYDWGFIGRDTMLLSDGDSHAGAGIGLRYATPIGPIRVDVGVPVSGPDSDSSFQIYVGIGQAF